MEDVSKTIKVLCPCLSAINYQAMRREESLDCTYPSISTARPQGEVRIVSGKTCLCGICETCMKRMYIVMCFLEKHVLFYHKSVLKQQNFTPRCSRLDRYHWGRWSEK